MTAEPTDLTRGWTPLLFDATGHTICFPFIYICSQRKAGLPASLRSVMWAGLEACLVQMVLHRRSRKQHSALACQGVQRLLRVAGQRGLSNAAATYNPNTIPSRARHVERLFHG
jgi:hypothetical protein